MALRPMYIIVGFDAEGNAVELGECEPSNPIAEAIIAQYTGPLVNLHWVTRDVEEDVPTMPTEDPGATAPTDPPPPPDDTTPP